MKYLVFVAIVMVAINGITAAPNSKAVCSPWLGYVSIIESKDIIKALDFFYKNRIHIIFLELKLILISQSICIYNRRYCCITNRYDYSVSSPNNAVVTYYA